MSCVVEETVLLDSCYMACLTAPVAAARHGLRYRGGRGHGQPQGAEDRELLQGIRERDGLGDGHQGRRHRQQDHEGAQDHPVGAGEAAARRLAGDGPPAQGPVARWR